VTAAGRAAETGRLWLAGSLAMLVMLRPSLVEADEGAMCADSLASAKQTRLDGSLVESHLAAGRCAVDACPEEIRETCKMWQRELDAILGTIEVTVSAPEGVDVSVAQIRIDGAEPLAPLGSRRFRTTAGKHVVEVVVEGHAPVEKEVQVAPDASTTIDVAIVVPPAKALPEQPPPTRDEAAAPQSKPSPPDTSDQPDLTFPGLVLLGVGGSGLFVFAVAASVGVSGYNDLDACRPRCPQAQADAVDTRFLVADVGLGLGLGIAAVGALLVIVGETTGVDTPRQVGFRF
jgi:hypothetical protein